MDYEPQIAGRYRPLPPRRIEPGVAALLVIDMQYGDAHPDFGLIRKLTQDTSPDVTRYFTERLRDLVVPNIRRLQTAFREHGVEVIHTKIQSLTQDGRDRSPSHKTLGIHFPPGSKEAEILDELAPEGDEIVITKTCGGVFNGTNLEDVLKNIGIQNLVIVGVMAGGCVESATRVANDRGFNVVLVEDGIAALTHERHTAAVRAMSGIHAKVESTDEVLEALTGRPSLAAAVPLGT
jgi:nicotinamidase-related amidase